MTLQIRRYGRTERLYGRAAARVQQDGRQGVTGLSGGNDRVEQKV